MSLNPIKMLDDRVILNVGDSRDILDKMPPNSVDAVVCDPPYALESIVKRFGKTSSSDSNQTGERARDRTDAHARLSRGFMGHSWDTGEVAFDPDFWRKVYRVMLPGAYLVAFAATKNSHRMVTAIEDARFEIRDSILDMIAEDEPAKLFFQSLNDEQRGAFVKLCDETTIGGLLGWIYGTGMPHSHSLKKVGKPGLGTALKPCWEPICLARKGLTEKTVAKNYKAHGTGALNIEDCKLKDETKDDRWPPNVLHDGSKSVELSFPKSDNGEPSPLRYFGSFEQDTAESRMLYSAKADTDGRAGSGHPTVKRLELMQWLVRLVTPPLGTVLDPFAGSGTTGLAAWLEGRSAILCERDPTYAEDIQRRMRLAMSGRDERKRIIARTRLEKGLIKVKGTAPLFDGM